MMSVHNKGGRANALSPNMQYYSDLLPDIIF